MAADPNLRRFRWIVFGGAVVGLVVLAALGGFGGGDDEAEDPLGDAEFACQRFISNAVDPLDVKFRDPGSATVNQDGESFTVRDRMVVGGDLTPYECQVRHVDDEWRLVNIDTP